MKYKAQPNKILFTATLLMFFLLLCLLVYLKSIQNYMYGIHVAMPDKTLTNIVPPERNYKMIPISGDNVMDGEYLQKAGTDIKKIVKLKDTLNGVGIKFGNKSSYASLIQSLDICAETGLASCALKENILWVFVFSDNENVRLQEKIYESLFSENR